MLLTINTVNIQIYTALIYKFLKINSKILQQEHK